MDYYYHPYHEDFEYKTEFKQSPITPRPIIFKIIWTIIIVLYCIALFKNFTKEIIIHSSIVLLLCIVWLRLFFTKKDPKKAFVVIISLLVSVLMISKKFYDIEPKYGKMQLLFIGWLCLATYFNYYIIANN